MKVVVSGDVHFVIAALFAEFVRDKKKKKNI
jgi:hypothetical protein